MCVSPKLTLKFLFDKSLRGLGHDSAGTIYIIRLFFRNDDFQIYGLFDLKKILHMYYEWMNSFSERYEMLEAELKLRKQKRGRMGSTNAYACLLSYVVYGWPQNHMPYSIDHWQLLRTFNTIL